jgi:hypothetical protein
MLSTILACGPAPPAASYTDLTTGVSAIQAHAKANGYAFFRRDKKAKRVVYACDRAGNYQSKGKNPDTHKSKQRHRTGSKKCDCKMRVALQLDDISGSWKVKVLEPAHNHGPSAAPSAHPAHRLASINPSICAKIKTFASAGLGNAQILSAIRQEYPATLLAQKDVSNIVQKARIEQLDSRTPIQWLIEVRNLKLDIAVS